MPQAAQSRHVPVVNPSAVERRRQLVSIELGIVSRPRNPAHVDDSLNAVRLEKADEVLYRPRRVTDREDDKRCPVSSRR
jgi:desulfoferrodoxin (superoxide reductase-like protein)